MGLIIGKENTFDRETLIYESSDEVSSISYIIEGTVRIETAKDNLEIHEGNFIAVKDLCDGFYIGDYYAAPGCRVMAFSADSIYSFIDFLSENPVIHKRYHSELCSMLYLLYEQYEILYSEITNIYNSLSTTYNRYVGCCDNAGVTPADFLMPHDATLYDFSTQPYSHNYSAFLSCYKSPEKLSMVYEKNPASFLKQQLNMIHSIYTTYDDMIFFLKTEISLFASKSQDCLFFLVSSLMEKVTKADSAHIMELLTDMKHIITHLDGQIKENTGITLDIDYNRVNFYFMMASNATFKENLTETDISSDTEDFSDDTAFDFSGTLLTLCSYGGFTREDYEHLNSLIEFYIAMTDKSSRDDDARSFRRTLSNVFFDLYEKVFLNYVKDSSPNKLIEFFLDYGLLDERLLTDHHLESLVKIKKLNDCSPCKVYRMSQWLTAIYKGFKMPSKNEFDKDYVEFIRERKRNEHLSPVEENALLNDSVEKVKFEINNMLKYNCRILNGNLLAFTPMLSMYEFDGDLDRFVLTSEMLNDSVNSCIAIDYSAFYREQMYSMPEKKIDKEVIQLQVFPDVILFPVYGINGVMWQDLSGKRSNTAGRFFFPSFFRGSISDTMITIIGRFRWELCKSVMGTAWNNIIVPSLTAEYSDYIQFYRKNRDLSADKREALKSQITRCRNNTREIFMTDYFIWIKYEAAGAVRLNKVSRQILATYCPFAKSLRDKLSGQPLYDDAMKRFNINRQKKNHEITTRMRALERAGAEITQEIYDTQNFYSL